MKKKLATYRIVSEARLRWAWGSPQKMRLVVELIRRRRAQAAADTLATCNRRAAEPILKLLRSAIANAGPEVDLDKLYVAEAFVDCGPSLKKRGRLDSTARGGWPADPKKRRQSHITIRLGAPA